MEGMVIKHSCMCMSCGRALTLVLGMDEDVNDQKCPICGGGNVVKYEPQSFFGNIFGASGGT